MTLLKPVFALMTLIMLCACVTPPPPAPNGRVTGRVVGDVYAPPPRASRGPVDMSGCDRLVAIKASNTTDGFAEENDWVTRNLPGGRIVRQRASECGTRKIDIVTIETKDGRQQDIFFDITSFFGKTKSGGDLDDLLDG